MSKMDYPDTEPSWAYDRAPTDPHHGGKLTADMAAARIAELEAALRGIISHWYEFGDMMIENKTDYGFSERMDAAAKLVAQEPNI